MPQKPRLIQTSLAIKIFIGVLAGIYMVYLVGLSHFLYPTLWASSTTIIDHPIDTNASAVVHYWTTATMQNAISADQQISSMPASTQDSTVQSAGKAAQQQGQPPQTGDASTYPLSSTVGKVFMTNEYGQDMVCSGTAVISANKSSVDTAGHCLYWNGGWVHNVIFCPLYDNGTSPYGCWVARDLEAPADWINAAPNDYHHDMGMAIVSPNSEGLLTDVVGGAGWAYNQTVSQQYSAYGYPAAYPFNGQTKQSCENQTGKSSSHGAGVVVSISCNMTGGSSGGPWFIQINGKWYLDGHNDFISYAQPGRMFSPVYDDTWHAMYEKAQSE